MAGRPVSGNKTKMVGAYFPPHDLLRLKALADREQRSESQMVVILAREAIDARGRREAKAS